MNGEAVYRQIAGRLREQITTGALPPGAPVPGVTALASEHGVTRVTARNARRLLEQEGLTVGGRVAHHDRVTVTITRSGTGWAGESPTAGADSWAKAIEAAGREPSQRIDVLTRKAEGKVAERLWTPPSDPERLVIERRLVRYADGEPHNMITFWFPYDLAEGTPLARPESVAEGTIAWLENQWPLTHWPPEITTRMPAPDEAEILRIPPGQPVLDVWRTSWADGRSVAASRGIYPGDRTMIVPW